MPGLRTEPISFNYPFSLVHYWQTHDLVNNLYGKDNYLRSYHVEIAALAAGSDQKWVDNLLSHFALPGVESARQGVARRISQRGLEHIALVRRVGQDVGLPLARAVDLAVRLLANPDGLVELAGAIQLRFDRSAFEAEISGRIADAAERSTPARRGRRPARSPRTAGHSGPGA
ncbi:MAG: hypothetical protein ACREMU_09350 [Gemmatimonadaceae bacterium]